MVGLGMEKMLIPALQELVRNLVSMSQTVRVQRPQCKALAELLKSLIPLLMEIQGSRHPLTEPTVVTFRTLMYQLIRTQKVMKRMKEDSKLKLFFRNTTLTDELSEVTGKILSCLSSLPLVQLRISAENRDEIKQLKSKLADLSNELKDNNSMRKDQEDLAAEITAVLRTHNSEEVESSGLKVMDKLVAWLAQRFDSDVGTVRREWEVVKEEAMSLREQVEFTSENKRQLEEELLQLLVYIDSEERQCATCTSRNATDVATSSDFAILGEPKEFLCSICLQLLEDPVITGAGFTYCRRCITNWFVEKDTCPNTNMKLITKDMIDNIALRSLIARWIETSQSSGGVQETVVGPELSRSASSVASVDFLSVEEFINEERERMMEQLIPGTRSTTPPSSSGPQSPVKSVTTYISLLSSNTSIQILKSLKQLTSIASFPKGQAQVFEAGGIPAVARLLKEKDTAFAEKAAGVLEALTFDIKGDNGESFENRDQVCSTVVDIALDDLFDLMLYGSNTARLKAAQTVINILTDEEIRAEVVLRSGVVSAFYSLISVGEEFLFVNEGKELCVKGLNLLLGEKGAGSTDAALAIVLLRLAALGVSPQVVEESLLALRLLVEAGGESICNTMQANKAVPFLVRSISRLPTGSGREDALKILNEMSQLVGMPEAIVKCELFSHLLPVLHEANHEGDCSNEATKLLSTCLSSVRDISQVLSQADLKGLVGLLCLERTSAASKVDIVSSLQYLCKESLSLRVAFLNGGGVASLLVLVKSAEMAAIKDEVAQLIRLLSSFPPCRKEICNQGGIQLISYLLSDETLECGSQVVVAAESLMVGPEGSTISLDGIPVSRVVDYLGHPYELECREAAVGVLSVFAARNCSMVWDRRIIKLLLDMVQSASDLPLTASKKAAATLLTITMQDSLACSHFVEDDGLRVLIEFGRMLGMESRPMIVQLLCVFCKADGNCKEAVLEVGGTNILLEALEKGRLKEEAAVALGHLIESVPARKAVLQAGFIQSAMKCILSNGGTQCAEELTRALVIVIDSKADAASVRESEGIQALVLVLEGSSESGKKLAVTALTKLMELDQESSILLGNTQGIFLLCKFLVVQQSEDLTVNVEALEALNAASEEQSNKIAIVQEQGIPLLLSISAGGVLREQELALQILLNLSREGPAPVEPDICGALLGENICKHLFDIIQPKSQLSVTEKAVYSAICIIRNLSLKGLTARTAMLEEGDGAIKVLLDRIRHHEANLSAEIVRGAVIALERFMLNSRGKMALIRQGGIRVIVQVLHHRVSGPAKSFATKILVMLAQEPQASKEVCLAIFEANVIPGLKDILELGPTSECKYQACILLKFLMFKGPRAAVCKKIREVQCIPKLLDLSFDSDVPCQEAATAALDLLKTYDKLSRKQIISNYN